MRRSVIAFAFIAACLAGLASAGAVGESVTMRARATVLRSGEFSVGVLGTVSSGAEGEYVAVKGKECGIPGAFFRGIAGATTTAGGGWEASVLIRTKTTLRAEWREATSGTVVITPRAYITLTKEPDGFRVALSSETSSVDGKRVTIQRLTPSGWKKLQTVAVKSQTGYAQYGEKKKLRFKVPKGTTLRAVLPRAQAGPCYLAGYSKLVRT
jgi:hypothetical protein